MGFKSKFDCDSTITDGFLSSNLIVTQQLLMGFKFKFDCDSTITDGF